MTKDIGIIQQQFRSYRRTIAQLEDELAICERQAEIAAFYAHQRFIEEQEQTNRAQREVNEIRRRLYSL